MHLFMRCTFLIIRDMSCFIDCGNVFSNGGGPAPDGFTGCNMPCNGNLSEFCGGPNRLDLYDFNNTVKASSSSSSTSTTHTSSSTLLVSTTSSTKSSTSSTVPTTSSTKLSTASTSQTSSSPTVS